MVCLDVSQNRKKYKDIYIFYPVPLFTCPTKTDAALVFRLIHVYNLCAIFTQTHNFAHFFIIFFVRARPLVVRETLVAEKLSPAIYTLYHFDLRVSARRRNVTALT